LILENTRNIRETVDSVQDFSTDTRGHIKEVSDEAQNISKDQKKITDTSKKSDNYIELLKTELKYFTMEVSEKGSEDSYDIEEKHIILDHKKRAVGGKALLEGRVNIAHVPRPDDVSACPLTVWLDRAEKGKFDRSRISELRRVHEALHENYNHMVAAYKSSDFERAKRFRDEVEVNWRRIINYRELLAEIIKAFKSGELKK
jgi:Na+/phosphate symporter